MISVVICSHNPHALRLARVFEALAAQDLGREVWECILVDNASEPALSGKTLPGFVRVVREDRLGLTWARRRGTLEAQGEIIVFVDDDNVLSASYLTEVLRVMSRHREMGCAGGKCRPIWEGGSSPAAWLDEFIGNLALRDLGEKAIVQGWKIGDGYPAAAPVGAGLVVRKAALASWLESLILGTGAVDRKGKALSSGGDNDIVLHVLRSGYLFGYFPSLSVGHIIPQERVTVGYTGRLARSIASSWVAVLHAHGIVPWRAIARWTLLPRKARAFVRFRAWSGPAAYVRWCAACGLLEGQAALSRIDRTVR